MRPVAIVALVAACGSPQRNGEPLSSQLHPPQPRRALPSTLRTIEITVGDRLVQRVRELVLAPRLAWERWLSPQNEGGLEIALSPTGARIALVQAPVFEPPSTAMRSRPLLPQAVVVDTASAAGDRARGPGGPPLGGSARAEPDGRAAVHAGALALSRPVL